VQILNLYIFFFPSTKDKNYKCVITINPLIAKDFFKKTDFRLRQF